MAVRDLLQKLWDSLKSGEIVLVERTDTKDQHIGIYHMMEWGFEKGYRVLIVDILDSLHLIKAKTKLSGLNEDVFDKVHVIKIGGKVQVGNVIEWIGDIIEPVIVAGKFREAYERFIDENPKTLVIVIGMEKLSLTSETIPKNVQVFIGLLSKYVGDERRLAVHFIKTYAFDGEKKFILGLLEDIATSVIRVSSEEKVTEFKVVKSIEPELEGLCIRL